jgi:hypothetical protein
MPDGVVRWPDCAVAPGRVAVVTVSYNHDELMRAFRAEVGPLDDQKAVEALTC